MIRGLERYGLDDEAERLRRLTLDSWRARASASTTSPRRASRSGAVSSPGAPPSPSTCCTIDGELRPGADVSASRAPSTRATRRSRRTVLATASRSSRSTAPRPSRGPGGRCSALGVHTLVGEVQIVDMRRHALPWAEVERLTTDPALADDPAFARIPEVGLRELLGELPDPSAGGPLTLVVGPGAALVPHDLLCASICRRPTASPRCSAARHRTSASRWVRSGQRSGSCSSTGLCSTGTSGRTRTGSTASSTSPTRPCRARSPATACGVALVALGRPFRTRPTFLPGPWGGQWLRTALGIETDETNLAWSYELITPESGSSSATARRWRSGSSFSSPRIPSAFSGPPSRSDSETFPIRFDYLDTMEGGHLSVQCHPGERYARETFGLDYTQEETYYVMATTPGGSVFLGLREDADVDAFREEAERAESAGVAFDPDRYLVRHPAERHRLYLIPPGTPHASGAGNAVLEISATPYLYTLRFYDWLRRDGDGRLRPVHVDHAFANLDRSRNGARVAELVPAPTEMRAQGTAGGSCCSVAIRISSSPSTVSTSPTRSRTTRGPLPRPQPRRGRRHRDRDRVGRSTCRSPRRSSSRRPWGRTSCGASAAAAARS